MISRRWAWLASFAILFAGVTNAHAHVHLCFDGQEPPASVHLSDKSGHHDGVREVDHVNDHGHTEGHGHHGDVTDHGGGTHHGDDADHDDVDLDLANPALAKTVKHDVASIAPAWLKGTPIAPATSEAPSFALERPSASTRTYLHPPLRAPPL